MGKVTAADISRLLIQKYGEKFVCIAECKVGSHWMMRKCPIIDLWCMSKSWANPRTIAFEIKASRQDFLRDDKWPAYLDYCTEFFFVAPPGIIDPAEVPEQAGLLISSKNAKLLYTKKKAPVRQVDIPDSIYRYILMWRSKVTKERAEYDGAKYWHDWLNRKIENKELGYNVSKRIRAIVRDRIETAESDNRLLKQENERLQGFKEILKEMGFENLSPYRFRTLIEKRMNEIKNGFPDNLENTLTHAIGNLELVKKTIFGGDKE